MIEELKPIIGKPTLSLRLAWLDYAKKLKCPFLIVLRLTEPRLQSIPTLVWVRAELFMQMQTLQVRHNKLCLELYDLNQEFQKQAEHPFILDYLNAAPPQKRPYDEFHNPRPMPNLPDLQDSNGLCSQFDLELWFYLGRLYQARYLIVTQSSYAALFYPLYVEQPEILGTIIKTNPDYNRGVIAIYDLQQNFDDQYMNSRFCVYPPPSRFWQTREEELPVLAGDAELDGFRRRLLDYFCFCQLLPVDNLRVLGSALELLQYGKKLPRNKKNYVIALLLTALDYISKQETELWKALPFILLLKYNQTYLYSSSVTSLFCSSEPGVRQFGMVCCSLFRVSFSELSDQFSRYYQRGYELRGLLYLLEKTNATRQQKLEFIQAQLKLTCPVDMDDYAPAYPSPDMQKELRLSLHPELFPNPFAESFSRYQAYKQEYYHKDNNLFYALHTDPTPRLEISRERKLCERRAAKGDLPSMLNLGAYYFWCEGEHGDYPKALKWLKKAVKLNHPVALCLLGWAIYWGLHVKRDPQKGLELLSKAAETGYATAYYYLSKCYESGPDNIQDIVKEYACLQVSRRALVDYPQFWGVVERISYLYYSVITPSERASAIALAEEILPTLRLIETEPAEYMGEVCQKELFENRICEKWSQIADIDSSLPITLL